MQGFSDFLPQLVDQMASASLEPDTKDQKLSYEVIRVEDTEQVLKLLKNTFFQVCWFLQFFFSYEGLISLVIFLANIQEIFFRWGRK